MIKLRSYQTEARDSIFDYYLRGGNGNVVLALPTGTGKSIVIGDTIRTIFSMWPSQRVMVLTHVRELIQQNVDALLSLWPRAPVGVYSAGLKRRDTINPIIYGGVASVVKKIEMFGHRDLLFIDEAHLLSPDGNTMYQKLIFKMKEINPLLKVIGFSATIFRLGQGLLTQDGLFNQCVFDICTIEGFHRLIIEGFLSPPIPRKTRTQLDVSGVSINKNTGDYAQTELSKAVDKPDVTYSALQELCEQGQDRHSWLNFCSGIEHANHCAEMLNSFGVRCEPIHSEISSEERSKVLKAFKKGEIRALTNNNVLTTGFDHPPIDLIGMLRPTVSPGLWVQMLGRGTRPSPETGKENCLVLDFAGNTKRLGPIDDPRIPQPKGKGAGDVPIKICDFCGTYNHTRVRFCISCGMEFTFQQKIVRQADTAELLTGGLPQVETYQISRVMYNRHVGKKSGKASIRVSYQCGLHRFSDFVSFDMEGFPRHRANEWWRARNVGEPPLSTDMALARLSELRVPRQVKVWVNQPYPKVVGVIW